MSGLILDAFPVLFTSVLMYDIFIVHFVFVLYCLYCILGNDEDVILISEGKM